MDEVRKDLSLSSIFPPATTSAAAGEPVFQDFLTCATSKIVKNISPSNKIPETDRRHRQRILIAKTAPSLFNASASPTGMCPCPGRKRVPANEEEVIDRKRKRLMKNRESAARSRARKQAYTYELEAEVAKLKEENADLRKQLEKLRSEAVADGGSGDVGDQHPKKKRICRTLSGPF